MIKKKSVSHKFAQPLLEFIYTFSLCGFLIYVLVYEQNKFIL